MFFKSYFSHVCALALVSMLGFSGCESDEETSSQANDVADAGIDADPLDCVTKACPDVENGRTA